MWNIALVCKYVAHMGHWPSGFSKNKLIYVLDLKISLYKLFNEWSLLKWHGEVCWNDTVKFAEMTRWSLLKWHGEICWNDTVKFAEMTRWSLLKWHGEVGWNDTVKLAEMTRWRNVRRVSSTFIMNVFLQTWCLEGICIQAIFYICTYI